MKHETMFDRTRGIKARLKYRKCEHGIVQVDNYEYKDHCEDCHPTVNKTHYVENTEGFFNRGLGCITYGTRDAEKKARRMGKVAIGDAKIEEVFRPPDRPHVDKRIERELKRHYEIIRSMK